MKAVAPLNEKQIKRLLVAHLRKTGQTKGAKVLSELCVGGFSRRADVVLVNGVLAAFEIKGENDDLTRLQGQVSTFSDYFEFLTVVCAPRHTAKVLAATEQVVGVWEISDQSLNVVRLASELPVKTTRTWLAYLPVRTLMALLRERGITARGRSRQELLEAADAIDAQEVRAFVLRHLKSRARVLRKGQKSTLHGTSGDPVAKQIAIVEAYLCASGTSEFGRGAIPRRRHGID